MKVKEDREYNRANGDDDPRYPFDATNAVGGRTQVAVAVCILIAMAAQPLALDDHVFNLVLRM